MLKGRSPDLFRCHVLLDSPIAFHRVFVSISGSITAALFLSQSVYWSKRTRNQGGWFYKNRKDWTNETGLSRFEQESARKSLKKIGVLEEKLIGLPAKLYFRLVLPRLDQLLSSFVSIGGCFPASKEEGNYPTSRSVSLRLAGGIPSGINKESETTPETTSEITERDDSPSSVQSPTHNSISLSYNFNNSSASSHHSIRDYQKNRYSDWVKKNWQSLQDEYLPYFQNNVGLLRWSLNNCIVWAHDNSEKARKYSNPGTRIRKWLDEEDVERLLRAMEGQGRAAKRVAVCDSSFSLSIMEEGTPLLDPSDPMGVVEHYRKVFSVFNEFIMKNQSRELGKEDWSNLEQAIEKDPAKFIDGNDFGALYEFFDIKLV